VIRKSSVSSPENIKPIQVNKETVLSSRRLWQIWLQKALPSSRRHQVRARILSPFATVGYNVSNEAAELYLRITTGIQIRKNALFKETGDSMPKFEVVAAAVPSAY